MTDKSNTSSGGGLGCLGFFIAVALIASAWMWSQGMDPHAAVEAGTLLSAKVTGWLCLGVVALFVGAVLISVFGDSIGRWLDW